MDDAMALSQQALDAGFIQVEPLMARASVALAQRQGAAARELLQTALKLNPDDARTWSSLGFAGLIDQEFGAAREAFETASSLRPSQIESWQGLGWTCVLQQDYPSAVGAFAKAVALDDESAESHGGKAVAHAAQGEQEDARQHIARALVLDGADPAARLAQDILAGKSAGPDALNTLASGLRRK
jgi:cytochrome c-type biogenesis protein CcmH/NrfG